MNKTELYLKPKILAFNELSLTQLYEVLKLRNDVFAVEQQSIYSDMDRVDYTSIHVLLEDGDTLAGYARLIGPSIVYKESSIGRIITHPDYRGKGLGKQLVQIGMEYLERHFPNAGIRLNAQEHLKAYYESFGFVKDSDTYYDGGLPHISMLKQGLPA